MKLWNDFGVRALLATICAGCFYAVLIIVLALKWDDLEVSTLMGILGLAQSPLMLALGFYFGTKANP